MPVERPVDVSCAVWVHPSLTPLVQARAVPEADRDLRAHREARPQRRANSRCAALSPPLSRSIFHLQPAPHAQKPLVRACVGFSRKTSGKYLEVFARKNNLRDLWVSVGNEVTGAHRVRRVSVCTPTGAWQRSGGVRERRCCFCVSVGGAFCRDGPAGERHGGAEGRRGGAECQVRQGKHVDRAGLVEGRGFVSYGVAR